MLGSHYKRTDWNSCCMTINNRVHSCSCLFLRYLRYLEFKLRAQEIFIRFLSEYLNIELINDSIVIDCGISILSVP